MKKAQTSLELITWKGQQSVNYRQIITLENFKVKLEIKRDSYDFQSSAVASVWSTESMEWKNVYSIPGQLMKTSDNMVHGVEKVIPSNIFSMDIQTLLTGAKSILF